MARLPRYVMPGVPQHVIQRGNNRCIIFHTEKDYLFYLEKLLNAAQEHDCHIHSYILMTNHVHLLVTPNNENSISKMQQSLGRCYVQYFNYRYHRTGTLWEGRYKATLVEAANYLFTCMRYIELNAVRAGMVVHPSEYKWSSYHYNARGYPDSLVVPHSEYMSLGSTDLVRQRVYMELIETLLSTKDIEYIRQQTNKGWALGSELFKKEIVDKINRQMDAKAKGGDRRSSQFRNQLINRV